jgi:hypothetical protein
MTWPTTAAYVVLRSIASRIGEKIPVYKNYPIMGISLRRRTMAGRNTNSLALIPAGGALLSLNRELAELLGMDPRYTISSNVALAISRATGVPFETAKLVFHAGVAGLAASSANHFGASSIPVLGLGVLVLLWLESFDGSSHKR